MKVHMSDETTVATLCTALLQNVLLYATLYACEIRIITKWPYGRPSIQGTPGLGTAYAAALRRMVPELSYSKPALRCCWVPLSIALALILPYRRPVRLRTSSRYCVTYAVMGPSLPWGTLQATAAFPLCFLCKSERQVGVTNPASPVPDFFHTWAGEVSRGGHKGGKHAEHHTGAH